MRVAFPGPLRTGVAMKSLLISLIAALLLGACATGGLSYSERLAMYREAAGAPVESFQYLGRIHGWTPLGDSALVLRTRPNQAYLLELRGTCPDLDFAHAITVSNLAGRVHARFDTVTVLGQGRFAIPCRIQQIRPVDVSAVRQAERELREQVEMTERPQDSGGT